ncbi:onanonoxo-7-onima-8-eninoihtemlysoneda [Coprinopsis marcescibilis]|uniref:Onanonoxo-7-onima-8-eninoihtemlysoneda n=1 Tax=Coprinopsis marcescibilis TaxID=230819 RepID=A0A5C3KKK5_COPMA|nr:onanonoxo-7-onima-8-eninoihtemlysoneda [Coprinopsis marcescibilis]
MSSLYKHLRVHQVFGANTDVGKTILTTALARTSARKKFPVFYLKPVSTGAVEDADDHHVVRFGRNSSNLIRSECLYRYDDPVSPHLAAIRKVSESGSTPTDSTLISAVANKIREYASKSPKPGHVYIETAGGVHSPVLSGTTQADCYRPLFLPTILVGDSKLGGISSTISSYESLLLRGYIVDTVVMFRDEYYRNWEYLSEYFKARGIHLSAVDPPPARNSNATEDRASTEEYYASLVASEEESSISRVIDYLDARHAVRHKELESMPQRSIDSIWWPFVQHGTVKGEQDVTVIDSAFGDFFSVYKQPKNTSSSSLLSPEFDGSASWWTQALGHANPTLTMAAARASGRYGHVMFPQATHLPALRLAERLIQKGPGKGWASRAFFSDNGSTGMEVAIKMALRAWSLRNGADLTKENKKKLGILGLKGSYHGDTIGAMDATEDGVYTCEWHDSKGYWFDPPTVGFQDGQLVISVPSSLSTSDTPHVSPAKSLGWVYDVGERLHTPLARAYTMHIRRVLDNLEKNGENKLAALVIEPLVMGAGGMIFVDPLFQRVLIDVVRGRRSTSSSQWSGLPIIFDEVFTGLQRIGVESAGPVLGVNPDISVHAKILTGGLIPLSITLASKSIFDAFWGDQKAVALLHGHSYTAHPIGCEVANETLAQIEKLTESDDWKASKAVWAEDDGQQGKAWSVWDPQFIKQVSKLPSVKEAMALGTVLAINFKDSSAGYTSFFAQNLLKPLKEVTGNAGELSLAPGGANYGINYRTLGNVGYFMTSLNTKSSIIRSIEDKIWKTISA